MTRNGNNFVPLPDRRQSKEAHARPISPPHIVNSLAVGSPPEQSVVPTSPVSASETAHALITELSTEPIHAAATRLPSGRVDPRIERTRLHVLETVRRMLADQVGLPLTFSSLSAEARVSRRTLYTHWGTIETIIRDGVMLVQTEEKKDLTGLSQREKLDSFLHDVARNLEVQVSYLAITSLLREAAFGNSAASEAIAATRRARTEEFRDTIGPVTDDQYAQLVGPILMNRMIHGTHVTEDFIQTMVNHGCMILGYDTE